MAETDAQIRHIYDRWHETIVSRDLDGLMALYAEDAILETPLILVTLAYPAQGIWRGKSEIQAVFRGGTSQGREGTQSLASNRIVLLQRSATDLGISPRNATGRPGGFGRGHGCR
jgi:ketosteroid isomerase-like protein